MSMSGFVISYGRFVNLKKIDEAYIDIDLGSRYSGTDKRFNYTHESNVLGGYWAGELQGFGDNSDVH